MRPSPPSRTRSEKPVLGAPGADGLRRAARFQDRRGNAIKNIAPPNTAKVAPTRSWRMALRWVLIPAPDDSSVDKPSESIERTANTTKHSAKNISAESAAPPAAISRLVRWTWLSVEGVGAASIRESVMIPAKVHAASTRSQELAATDE